MVKLSFYKNLGIEDFSKLGLVWNLFANFGKSEKEEIISQSRNGSTDRYDFTDRLIEKAAAGGIDLSQEDFNIGGYDYVNRNYATLASYKKLEKEVYLVNEIDKGGGENTSDGYGEYSENRLVQEESDFDLLDMDIDYILAWSRFSDMSKRLERKGYSLVYLLLSVIEGVEEAKNNLSKVCSEDEDFKEWVESIFLPDKLPDILARLKEFKEIGAFV